MPNTLDTPDAAGLGERVPRESIMVGFGTPDAPRWWPWRFVAHGDHVYAMRVAPGTHSKVSLHADGTWQFSSTAEHWATMNRPNSERHVQRWERPPQIHPGVTFAVRLLFAEPFMPELLEGETRAHRVDHWLPVRANQLAHLCLVYRSSTADDIAVRVTADEDDWQMTECIWDAALPSGERICLYVALTPLHRPYSFYFFDHLTKRIARREGNRPGDYRGTICLTGDGPPTYFDGQWRLL